MVLVRRNRALIRGWGGGGVCADGTRCSRVSETTLKNLEHLSARVRHSGVACVLASVSPFLLRFRIYLVVPQANTSLLSLYTRIQSSYRRAPNIQRDSTDLRASSLRQMQASEMESLTTAGTALRLRVSRL
ncbi:hypothetical protein PZA11_003629 [Diplocarpon coronariae]